MTLGTTGEMLIPTEEYKELIEKALRYDLLKNHLSQKSYLTEAEKLLLGIEEKEN